MMLSVNLVAYLNMRFTRKIAVIACFAPRALVIGATLMRLLWLYLISPHGTPKFMLWIPALIAQVHVCLSICTASIPYMVPFFKSLEGTTPKPRTGSRRDSGVGNERGSSRSVSWFVQGIRGGNCKSHDSVTVTSRQHEQIPKVSHYKTRLELISPLAPARLHTPRSRVPSRQGLCISVLVNRTSHYTDMVSSIAAYRQRHQQTSPLSRNEEGTLPVPRSRSCS